ncbi:hypothetical protein TRIUR3_17588 [Triticum urartu]|uniref:Late embryogenesis abundant protein LEA-2 subgroup domain-containing protein n=1 Tax=Triticum urartu TaxID=4572 RepID=M7Z218_TRIUA|nr:hypothetical protein TRIUR3_17588 [Triticum urartu]
MGLYTWCYALAASAFVAVFAFFLLVLWGASKSYKPHVDVKSVVFESYHIQGGTDRTGVPTRMMSVNATVRLRFRNRGTFFGLHVTAAPFHLFFDDLTVASGNTTNETVILSSILRLAFVLRARAHILGLLLRSKFYRRGVCRLDVREAHLGKPVPGVAARCEYHDGR